MKGWRVIWQMTIHYSRYDVRTYQWIENEAGETAFVWIYGSKEW